MTEYSGALHTPTDARYVIIASRWNAAVVEALVNGAQRAFADHGVDADAVDLVRVPGAWDIPAAAAHIVGHGEVAAVLALGCVVRGETRHYEHVADGCATGLMQVAVAHAIPVLNGVLAVEQLDHAQARAGGEAGNKGAEVALAAIELANLWRQW